jgi:tetratricopeptide (TPR) repeat protein
MFCGALPAAADPGSLEVEAARLYQEGDYVQAATLYQEVLDGGLESTTLYYNLGNCFYKQNEIARAILNYERALLLTPGDEDVEYNLMMARRATVDKINVLPELFLMRWHNAILTSLTVDQWAYLSVALFLLFLGAAVLFFHATSITLKKSSFAAGLVLILFTMSSLWFASKQYRRTTDRREAIVMTPSVVVRGAPDQSGTELYVVHEGLKITVIETLGQWYNIRLADGNVGWVPQEDVEKI